MKYLIFLITIMFSSNLLSATYLICKNPAEINKVVSVKIDNKKIFINYNNYELVDWTPYITKITKEEIVLQKDLHKTEYLDCKNQPADILGNYRFGCDKSGKTDYFIKQQHDRIVDNLGRSYVEYKFDRISGKMSWMQRQPFVGWNDVSEKPYRRFNNHDKDYQCEVKDGTLF